MVKNLRFGNLLIKKRLQDEISFFIYKAYWGLCLLDYYL